MISWVLSRGWTFWLILFLIIIVILWIIRGGKSYQFIGISPLSHAHPDGVTSPMLGICSYLGLGSQPSPVSYPSQPISYPSQPVSYPSQPVSYPPQLISHPSQPASYPSQSTSYSPQITGQPGEHDDPVIDMTPIIPQLTRTARTVLRYVPYQIEQKENTDNEESMDNTVISESVENRPGYRSRREALCCHILEDIYRKRFTSIRPDFLKNPETGYNLEIDCYNDELKLGLEFSGVQHYVFPNYTGQTYEQFMQQIRRDMFKVEACDVAGVYLITVPYNVPDNMLRQYIEYYLPENVSQRSLT